MVEKEWSMEYERRIHYDRRTRHPIRHNALYHGLLCIARACPLQVATLLADERPLWRSTPPCRWSNQRRTVIA